MTLYEPSSWILPSLIISSLSLETSSSTFMLVVFQLLTAWVLHRILYLSISTFQPRVSHSFFLGCKVAKKVISNVPIPPWGSHGFFFKGKTLLSNDHYNP